MPGTLTFSARTGQNCVHWCAAVKVVSKHCTAFKQSNWQNGKNVKQIALPTFLPACLSALIWMEIEWGSPAAAAAAPFAWVHHSFILSLFHHFFTLLLLPVVFCCWTLSQFADWLTNWLDLSIDIARLCSLFFFFLLLSLLLVLGWLN